MKVEIPSLFADVTIDQFVAFKTARTDIERVMAATGLTRKLAGGIEAKSVQFIVQTFHDLITTDTAKHERILKIGGKDYGFIPSLDAITFQEHIDITGLAEQIGKGRAELITLMMAAVYRPITMKVGDKYAIEDYDSEKAKERAPLFGEVSMETYNGVLLFFSIISREFASASRRYSEAMNRMMVTEMKEALRLIDEELLTNP
jgi:hypothetical protein